MSAASTNNNENPVAEKAVFELEEEHLCQEPVGSPITELSLVVPQPV